MATSGLIAWLEADFARTDRAVTPVSLVRLDLHARQIVETVLARPPELRPSYRGRVLAGLSKHLRSALAGYGKLDEVGREGLCAAAGLGEDSSAVDRILVRLAAAAAVAHEGAAANARSEHDHHGGPTRDVQLRTIVASLYYAYLSHAGEEPKLLIDFDTRFADTGFSMFVKKALQYYAAEGISFGGSAIAKAVSWQLSARDLTDFDPSSQ